MLKILVVLGLMILYAPRIRPSVIKEVTARGVGNKFLLLMEAVVVCIAATQLLYSDLIADERLVILGLVVFVCGVSIATVARIQLKENYAPALSIKPSQEIVRHGLYTFVRHPVYLGMILVCFGFELLFHPLLAILSLLSVGVFVFQIRKEEKLLSLNTEWEKFTKQTKYRLIPHLW